VFPIIALNIPVTNEEEAAALALQAEATDTQNGRTYTILDRWTERADHTVRNANGLMSILNREQSISADGQFFDKGPDQGIDGEVKVLADDPDYTKEAIVCYNDAPFVHLKWNDDGSKVLMTRDLSNNPGGALGTAMMVKMNYVVDEAGVKNLFMTSFGVPWNKPDFVTDDGDSIAEFAEVVEQVDGSVDVSAVEEWQNAEDDLPSAESDGYLVGRVNADASGEFVGYRKFDTYACADGFDQTDNTAPGWCHGRAIGGERYTDAERDDAWLRLQSIGILNSGYLEKVAFGEEVVCPTPAEAAAE
jgi:hypothetical protein